MTLLRQRSRPYLFSNSIAPPIVAASLAVFDLLETEGPALRRKLWDNTRFFRDSLTDLNFDILPGDSVLSGLRAAIVYDTRDTPFLPTRGSLRSGDPRQRSTPRVAPQAPLRGPPFLYPHPHRR